MTVAAGDPADVLVGDYVVVGAGSAGAVVAARLSEDPRVRVILLEAGPRSRGEWTRVPLGFGKILADPRNLWTRTSAPEPALGGRGIGVMHGRVLGGSSAVNGMVYVRGFPLDYALWRQLGATGWGYDDVLPWFRKAERFEGGESRYHGGDGPVGVEGPGWRTPLADAFVAGAHGLGVPLVDDLAGPQTEGVGYHHLTTWRGRRASTWHSYLAPAARRPNLTIIADALVDHVLFEGRRATGVAFVRDGRRAVVRAAREVVLSAGALHTPQLLQRSGVGPAPLLAGLGIPVVADLPGVGGNLMDHLQVTRSYSTTSPHTINALMRSRAAMVRAGLAYYLRRRGPMTVGAALAGGFARTSPDLDAPDIQIGFSPFLADGTGSGLAAGSGFLLAVYQLRPESRGHVRITSADPAAPADVIFNVLSAARDGRVLHDGVRFLGRIAASHPMRRLDVVETSEAFRTGDDADEARVAEHVARVGGSSYHYSGTARMGTDDGAAVDPELRVHGVERLRVVDASVMPTVTSGNTNAASIMIGERGADFLRRSLRQETAA